MAFNLTSLIPGVGHENEHVATYAIVAVVTVCAGLIAKSKINKQVVAGGNVDAVPDGKFSLKSLFEMLTEYIAGLAEMVIGHEGRKYVPMFASIFVFILINNFVGVIPGMTPATEQLNTTLAMGTFMFLFYNYIGIREHGAGYIKHFLGPLWWLAPLMLVIELIAHIVRPISLGLRLGNVMAGDHMVVGIFTDLVPFLLPIPFYVLGLFVCFIQAFVFTLLSMVYVALASSHDH